MSTVRTSDRFILRQNFAQAFFSICMVVEDSCFVPVPTHNIKYNIKYRLKFKSKHKGNHGRANVHLIDQYGHGSQA